MKKIILLFVCASFILLSRAQKPNILFCLADDAGFQQFGAYGSKWVKTPVFDRIAKEGLLFKNAYTPNAKCGPSRASILTGRNSWQIEELGNHLAYWPKKYISFVEVLAKDGYAVGYTGKGWAPGDPGKVNGKPRELTGKPYLNVGLKAPTTGISNLDYDGNFKEFLDKKPQEQPFFFWFGSLEPHRAYEYESGAKKGGLKTSSIDDLPAFWPDNDSVRNDMLDYGYEIQYFDKQVGRMLKTLEEKGLLENTIIIVTSDNGMPFPRVKGQEYELSNHLPLAIMWKNGIKFPGREIKDYISFIDFAPTIFKAAGLRSSEIKMPKLQGKPLQNIFNSSQSKHLIDSSRDFILIGQERHDVGRPYDVGYPIRGIVKNGFLYLKNFQPDRWPVGNPETGYLNTDGGPTKTAILKLNRQEHGTNKYWAWSFGKRPSEELYHIAKDPLCLNNLATSPRFIKQREGLKSQMFEELTRQSDPRMLGNGSIFDKYSPYMYKGFYERFMKGERPELFWVEPTDFEKQWPIQ